MVRAAMVRAPQKNPTQEEGKQRSKIAQMKTDGVDEAWKAVLYR